MYWPFIIERHTDVSPEDVSERWLISVQQAKDTLKIKTQNFFRSALLSLSRRYWADRMYHTKILRGQWANDTIDDRDKSLDGNRYAQILNSKQHFAKLY